MTEYKSQRRVRIAWLLTNRGLWEGIRQNAEGRRRMKDLIISMRDAGLYSRTTALSDIRIWNLLQETRQWRQYCDWHQGSGGSKLLEANRE
jgi:hypothetical protein